MLTVEEVAELLRLCPNTVYAMVNQRAFPHIRVGRRKLVPKLAVIEWLKANTEGTD